MNASELIAKRKFEIGEEVEFSIKAGKDTGIVGHIIVCPDGLLYDVVWSNKSQQKHYDFELKKVNR